MHSAATNVTRWTKKVCNCNDLMITSSQINFFNADLQIIPIHLGVHWAVTFVPPDTHAMEYYDSLLFLPTYIIARCFYLTGTFGCYCHGCC